MIRRRAESALSIPADINQVVENVSFGSLSHRILQALRQLLSCPGTLLCRLQAN
jgi:hypothetical protein